MVSKNKYLNDKEWLYQEYIKNKKSTVEIAKEINSHPSSVLKWLKKYDSSRLVDNTSGWIDQGSGDFQSNHI